MADSQGKTVKPIKVFRLRGTSVSVFANPVKNKDAQDSTFYKFSVQRTYKDSNGEFRQTSTFALDDLPVVWLLVQKAWEFTLALQAKKD